MKLSLKRRARQREMSARVGQVRGEIAQRVVAEGRGEREGLVGAAADQRFVVFGRGQREAVLMASDRVGSVGVGREAGLPLS